MSRASIPNDHRGRPDPVDEHGENSIAVAGARTRHLSVQVRAPLQLAVVRRRRLAGWSGPGDPRGDSPDGRRGAILNPLPPVGWAAPDLADI
jgi:hypothetical protein